MAKFTTAIYKASNIVFLETEWGGEQRNIVTIIKVRIIKCMHGSFESGLREIKAKLTKVVKKKKQ